MGDSLKLDLGVSVIENEKNQIVASGWQLRQWPNFFPAIYVLDSLGNVLKTKYFNGPNDSGGAIINKYKKGKYIIQASLDTIISQGDDSAPVYIALLDSNYNFIWRTIYHRIEILGVYNIDTTHDGGIIMCGSISAPPSPQLGWFAKVDSMGNKLWEHIYQHTGPNTYQNFFGDARETYDHGFILSGMNYDFFLHTQDSWIVKLDSNGCLAQGCGINTDVVEIHPDWPIQVFPNPAHDQVRIDLRNGKGTLEIFDAFGRLVHTQMVVDQPLMDLDINSYSAGLYIIRYSTNSGVNTMRLVKQ